jgi:hypothetical protein
VCTRVGNQRSRGVVIARVQANAIRSLRHQRRDLHQSTYSVPLGRSRLILLSGGKPDGGQGCRLYEVTIGSKSLAPAFFVVEVQRNYSVILGRGWINANCCVPCTLH